MTLTEALFFNFLTMFGQAFLTDVEPMVNYSPDPIYAQEMYCLSINTYHEARGETFDGKVAIAQSVMSRVNDEEGEFRNYDSPCEVVERSKRDYSGNPVRNACWYSWYCDGKPDHVRLYKDGVIDVLERQAWQDSVLASFYAYHDMYEPIALEATHYYNYTTVNPSWAEHYEVVVDVGDHRFLK